MNGLKHVMISSTLCPTSTHVYPLSTYSSGMESLNTSVSSIFQSSIPPNFTTTLLNVTNRENSFSSRINLLGVMITAALATVTIYSQFKSETIIPPPIGLPNKGNHCCFISALQVLFNTASWASSLEGSVLKPVFTAYKSGHTSQLNFEEIRKAVNIHEENQFITQQDPAAYIRALGEVASKQLSTKTSYYTEGKILLSDRGIPPPDDSLISLGIPTGSPLELKALLGTYFCSSFKGHYSKEQDKLIEGEGEKILIGRSLAGTPPDDIVMQIKRFGFLKPKQLTTEVREKAVTRSLFQKIKAFILRILGLYEEPSVTTTVPDSTSQGGDYKIKDPIDTPFTLEMNPEWFEGQKNPVTYACQSFLCHRGETIRSGHYVAYVRKGDTWYECNDATVTIISKEAAKTALQTSYILSYRKVC